MGPHASPGPVQHGDDSGLFETRETLEQQGADFDGWAWHQEDQRWLPLYEAKMLSHWDHRFATYDGATQAQLNEGTLPRLTDGQHDDPDMEPLARYWVAEDEIAEAIDKHWDRGWFLGWREIVAQSDCANIHSRACSRYCGRAISCPISVIRGTRSLRHVLHAVWSSFAFDYVAQQKLSWD